MENLHEYFNNVKKGFTEKYENQVDWYLGNMRLRIYTEKVEYYVSVEYKKKLNQKYWWEITHLHIFFDELVDFIKEIDNNDNVIEVKRRLLLGETFSIINKENVMKKRGRYYSI